MAFKDTPPFKVTPAYSISKISPKLPNSIGMFQGSALGPLLFTMFAGNLSLFADDAFVVQYTDDTQLLISGPKSNLRQTITRLEQILISLDHWFSFNGLKLNADKTQLMLLGSQQNIWTIPHFTIRFRDHVLVPCLEAKKLGLFFDRTLSWNSHVSLVRKRCLGILTGLSHLKHCLPASVLALVNAVVLSQVWYCLSVY